MSYSYDLEAGKKKLPEAIEVVDIFANQRCKKVMETLVEEAGKTGADKVVGLANQCAGVVELLSKMFADLLGQEGDRMSDGTLYGAHKGIKDMDTALNGGAN